MDKGSKKMAGNVFTMRLKNSTCDNLSEEQLKVINEQRQE